MISEDPAPGGMFRRWPHFQRLLSWTKPHAPAERGSRAYERYDWNSLLADEPEARALQPDLMDGTSYFPSRPEMEANLGRFAERAHIDVRYECRWTATRQRRGPDGRGFIVDDHRRRLPRRGAGRRGRRGRAVLAAGDRHGADPPLRRRPAGGDLRRAAGLIAGQAELRVRAGQRPAAVGSRDRAGVAVAGASSRCRPGRWSASGRATSSRTRTTSSAAASRCSTPRSTGSSGPKEAMAA